MKYITLLLLATFIFIYSGNIALAHPGRLDKYGGHTCRTNCAKWGLKTGQYHKHR